MNREEFRLRDKKAKEEIIENFTKNINVLHDNTDGVTIPSISILKDESDKFVDYYVAKYPTCLEYGVVFYKKDYPYSIYYSKKYYKHEVPKKYATQFTELAKYFPDRS